MPVVNVMFQLDQELHRALKLYCSLRGISMRSYVSRVLIEKLKLDQKKAPNLEAEVQARYEETLDTLPLISPRED